MRAVTLSLVAGLASSLLAAGTASAAPVHQSVPPDGGVASPAGSMPAGMAAAAGKVDSRVLAAANAFATASAGAAKIPVIITLARQADLRSIPGRRQSERRRSLISRLKATANAAQGSLRGPLAAMVRRGQADRVRHFWGFDGIALDATAGAIQELAGRPEVRSITLDAAIPGPQQSSGGPPGPNLARVNAPALWDLGYRGQGVVVANMDTGVDVTHPDLAAGWRGGSNSWFDPYGQHPATPTDLNGHGTSTMGVMVGRDAGGTAVGMAPDARWIAVKIFNDSNMATTSGIHAGFQWLLDPDQNPATDDAADVVNSSWALSAPGCNLTFQLDLRALRAAGILPVFAAGNYGPTGSTSTSPANNPEAFAVGATGDDDAVWPGSSRGPSGCGEPQTTYPELTAPGVAIHTTDIFGLYADVTGTSIAAPHVSGALALLLSASPSLTADQQQAALTGGAVDLGPAGPDNDSGYGRLDVLASYQHLAPTPDFTVAAAPASASTTPGGSVAYTVTVAPVAGFTDAVALSLDGLSAAQASWSFTPPAVEGGSGSSQLAVVTSAGLAPGSYPLTITASSGSLVHAVPVTLVVNPPQDFGLAVTPSWRSVYRGSSTTYTVGVSSVAGFAGTVGLSVAGLPVGTTASFNPVSVVAPGTSTMTVRTTLRTPRGTFTLTVTGQSGTIVHSTTNTLIVR